MKAVLLSVLLFIGFNAEAQYVSNIKMSGKVSVTLKNGKVTLKIAKITNMTGDGIDSGDLQISAWASKRKLKPGQGLRGHQFYFCSLDYMPDNSWVSGVYCRGRQVRRIPKGTWYIIVEISEWTEDEAFYITDYIHMSKRWKF